tara:strand:- start:80 stop:688 length:609 start_codon:yes stop_codon:yes gene_type:complete
VLIAFEGIDGGGKTTQMTKTKAYLTGKGYTVKTLQEPTDGPWGKKIREMARRGRGGITPQEELSLFLKDRREDVAHNIRPALKQKKIVLLDRYYYSTVAYQGALGLDPVKIQKANEVFAPRPDLVILLQISPQTGLARLKEGRRGETDMAYEQEDYLVRVQEIFDRLKGSHIHRLNAERLPDEVTAHILEVIENLLIEVVNG